MTSLPKLRELYRSKTSPLAVMEKIKQHNEMAKVCSILYSTAVSADLLTSMREIKPFSCMESKIKTGHLMFVKERQVTFLKSIIQLQGLLHFSPFWNGQQEEWTTGGVDNRSSGKQE